MNRLSSLTRVVMALLLPGTMLLSGDAAAQPKTLNEQIAGAWRYVSVDTIHSDGSRVPIYGPNPKGLVIFDGHGHYVLVNARADLPKFASNNRITGTPEEYKAVVQGSIAHFGKYTINEADKTITFDIETSTYPNWNGIEQKRPFTLNKDELRWTTAGASSGGTAEVVLKRAD